MFEVEKNVPMPPVYAGRNAKYPFADMEVGDSFAIPLDGVPAMNGGDRAVATLRSSAIQRSKRHGGKYAVRTDREVGVARCWRVE
jgi:hypothetical protein